jgi:glycosyltransferase involved in cell wall biosynthesis
VILLHAAPIDWKQLAGPNASVPGLVAAQNALREVSAALLATVPGVPPPCTFPVFGVESVRTSGRLALPSPFDKPDLVIFHSTYIPLHATIAKWLKSESIPYLICPRGGMTRYAQASKRWKKAAGNALFFNRMVRGARALHCLTSGEAEASCDWRKPALVVGNGVELPAPARLRAVHQPLRAAFMGRLHVDHKGLDLLVDACGLIRNAWVSAGARLEIHGPDCGGSAAELRKRIARNGAGEVVDLKGPVLDRDKARFFNSIDVFLHPSRTEGHPIAVLEALAHGVPCLLTPNTNMAEEVVAAEAGWVVQATREGVARGLLKLLDLSPSELETAGRNARCLAEDRYTWPMIAERSIDAYRRFAA